MSNQRLQKLIAMHQEQPDDTFLVYAIGMEHLGAGELHAAKDFFLQTIQIDQGYTAAYYQLGIILNRLEHQNEALTYLEKGYKLAQHKKDLKTMNEFRSLIDEISF